MSEWQPIETAPKDGEVWLFGRAIAWDGYYADNVRGIGQWLKGQAVWMLSYPTGSRLETIEPVYWQPLPEPPRGP